MRIGLVDVDGHGKKKKWGASIYPNLALMKLSRWHKEQGDQVEWAIPWVHYDVVYKAKVFNFSPDDLTCYDADRVVCGGTGYDIASRLPDEVDRMQPDYSLYPLVPDDTAYGFLTRGCPNRCPWCVVPRKEGRLQPYMDVDDIAIEGRHKLVLMDNNILAAGDYAVEQLGKIIKRGYRVDFNQALDARLVTDELAALLAQVRWLQHRIRFGCDTHAQIAQCERAIALIERHGYRGEFFLYTMLDGDFANSYDRINHWWLTNKERRKNHRPNIYAYAQPYRDPDNPNAPVPQWQKDMASWCNKRMLYTTIDFKEFKPRKGFRCDRYFDETETD